MGVPTEDATTLDYGSYYQRMEGSYGMGYMGLFWDFQGLGFRMDIVPVTHA